MQCFAKFCKQCFASFVNTSFARFRKYIFRSFTFVSPIQGCKVSQTRVSLCLQGFTILSSQEFSNKFFVSLVSQGVCNRQFANEHMNTTAYTSARSGGLISLCYPTALSSGMEVLKLYKQKWKEEGGKKCMGTKSLWEIGRCNCWPKIYRVFKNKPTWFCFLEAKWHWDLEEFWGKPWTDSTMQVLTQAAGLELLLNYWALFGPATSEVEWSAVCDLCYCISLYHYNLISTLTIIT